MSKFRPESVRPIFFSCKVISRVAGTIVCPASLGVHHSVARLEMSFPGSALGSPPTLNHQTISTCLFWSKEQWLRFLSASQMFELLTPSLLMTDRHHTLILLPLSDWEPLYSHPFLTENHGPRCAYALPSSLLLQSTTPVWAEGHWLINPTGL